MFFPFYEFFHLRVEYAIDGWRLLTLFVPSSESLGFFYMNLMAISPSYIFVSEFTFKRHPHCCWKQRYEILDASTHSDNEVLCGLPLRESEGSFQYGNYHREADDLRAVVQHSYNEKRLVIALVGSFPLFSITMENLTCKSN